MSWVTYKSPLWKKDKVPDKVKPLPSLQEKGEMESKFVNDAVEVYMRSQYPKFPIIPPYNAVKDKYAQAYFQSSLVKGILTRNEILRKNAEVGSNFAGGKRPLEKKKHIDTCSRLV